MVTRRRSTPTVHHHKRTAGPNGPAERLECTVAINHGMGCAWSKSSRSSKFIETPAKPKWYVCGRVALSCLIE
eukprot:5418326-Prymnesium_polylepis.1